jgi:hypothetical protein
MAGKDHVLKYSQTAALNTDIANINIDEGCDPSNLNNSDRANMKQQSDGFISRIVDKATGATAGLTDHNQIWRCTADLTITLAAAATLTSGWCLHVLADGGNVTVDGDSSETIDGALTVIIPNGRFTTIYCTGSALHTNQGRKVLTPGTAQAASGTAVNFTGIPSWARRVSILFQNVSLDGSDNLMVQIGDSGGLENTGYVSTSNSQSATGGFVIAAGAGSVTASGIMHLMMLSTDLWVSSHSVKLNTTSVATGGGHKTLSATLDRLSVVATGSNNFDGGNINIFYD